MDKILNQEKLVLITPIVINKIMNLSKKDRRPAFYKSNSTDNIGAFIDSCHYIIDNIYLGSCLAASDIELLKKKNIKYVCNISDNIPNFFEKEGIKYFNIKKKDNGLEDITIKELNHSYNFIINSNKKNDNILIHCFVGRSRSVSILIYYLMKKYDLSIKESIIFLKSKRKWINPSIKFVSNIHKIINDINNL